MTTPDTATIGKTTLRKYAADPAKFQAELIIPSGHGPRLFGEVMADFQRERFAMLNPSLLAVARGEKPPTPRHWWEATKGASKDSDLAVCLLWLVAFTRRPLNCQIGAADQDQAAELRKAARAILDLNPGLADRVTVQNWKIVCTATNSEAVIVAADVTGSHGARPDVLILNELSHIAKQEFAENLLDNASKVPLGLVVIATNAGFSGTWQAKWRVLAGESDRWAFHAFSRPAPWLDPKEIEEARRRNSVTRFARLWEGIWASASGDALDAEDLAAAMLKPPHSHLPAPGPMTGDEPGWSFVAGLDLSTRRDHSALVVLGVNGQTHRVRVATVQGWAPIAGRVDLQAVQHAVLKAHEQFNLRAVFFDPFQAELMADQLRKAHVTMQEMTFGGANLNRMATALLEVFRERKIDLYDDPQLLRDLQRLTIEEKSYGYRLTSTRDADGHADRATALAIALPGALELAASGSRGPIVLGGFGVGLSFGDLQIPRGPTPTYKDFSGFPQTR
jgi:hypothetical protein